MILLSKAHFYVLKLTKWPEIFNESPVFSYFIHIQWLKLSQKFYVHKREYPLIILRDKMCDANNKYYGNQKGKRNYALGLYIP